ncbi:hypothetical protein JCM14467A_01650 [Vulcanisaeta sp. JCM 14467]
MVPLTIKDDAEDITEGLRTAAISNASKIIRATTDAMSDHLGLEAIITNSKHYL